MTAATPSIVTPSPATTLASIDDMLARLSATQRAYLAAQLAAVSEAQRSRRNRWLAIVALGAAGVLIPWTVLLGLTLPTRYVTDHWTLTWVGFDTALLASFVAIAVAAWRRSHYLGPAAVITATLLACDAWFDITTASTGADLVGSLLTAIAEIPIAAGLAFLVVQRMRRRVVTGS